MRRGAAALLVWLGGGVRWKREEWAECRALLTVDRINYWKRECNLLDTEYMNCARWAARTRGEGTSVMLVTACADASGVHGGWRARERPLCRRDTTLTMLLGTVTILMLCSHFLSINMLIIIILLYSWRTQRSTLTGVPSCMLQTAAVQLDIIHSKALCRTYRQ